MARCVLAAAGGTEGVANRTGTEEHPAGGEEEKGQTPPQQSHES
jgi:hypothetical protein